MSNISTAGAIKNIRLWKAPILRSFCASWTCDRIWKRFCENPPGRICNAILKIQWEAHHPPPLSPHHIGGPSSRVEVPLWHIYVYLYACMYIFIWKRWYIYTEVVHVSVHCSTWYNTEEKSVYIVLAIFV